MVKMRKSIVGIFMSMVMLVVFCVPTLAMQTDTEFTTAERSVLDGGISKIADLDKGVRAGRVFVTGLEVYAYKSSTNEITANPVAANIWPGGSAFPNVTVPLSTFQDCDNYGCDYWLVYLNFTVQGTPYRLSIYVNNNRQIDQSISAGSYSYEYAVPFSRADQQFRITLDNTGATAFGNIYIG